ncbi:uncharacterized [Tachysurus ichikawai]
MAESSCQTRFMGSWVFQHSTVTDPNRVDRGVPPVLLCPTALSVVRGLSDHHCNSNHGCTTGDFRLHRLMYRFPPPCRPHRCQRVSKPYRHRSSRCILPCSMRVTSVMAARS